MIGSRAYTGKVSCLLAIAIAGCFEAGTVPGVAGLRFDAGTSSDPDIGPGAAPRPDAAPLPDGTIAPPPPPPPTDEEAPNTLLDQTIRGFQGTAAIFAVNLQTESRVAVNADAPMPMGHAGRLLPVVAYAIGVATGELDPATEVVYTGEFLRSGGGALGEEHVGDVFELESIVRNVLLKTDPSAEALLVEALGGSAKVNAVISELGINGFGRYMRPCEHHRAFTTRLDPRFEDASCPALSRWVSDDDPAALVPDVLPDVPMFTDAQLAAAWQELTDARLHTASARAWGTLLASVQVGTAGDAVASGILRELLERGLGAGGGGDLLPDRAWVANIGGRVFNGRHWMAIVTRAGPPVVLIMLTRAHQSANVPVGTFFADAGLLMFEQLVGPVDLTPPATVSESPDWLSGVFLVEAEESGGCNSEFRDDFDGLVECRRSAQRGEFSLDERSAAAVLIRDAPVVDALWLWTEPTGTRHRYQVRLDEGGWWAWTRSFRVHRSGPWRLDVYLNGEPTLLSNFMVEDPAGSE